MRYVSRFILNNVDVLSSIVSIGFDEFSLIIVDTISKEIKQYNYIDSSFDDVIGIKIVCTDSYFVCVIENKLLPLLDTIEVLDNRRIDLADLVGFTYLREYVADNVFDGIYNHELYTGNFMIYEVFYNDFVKLGKKLPDDNIIRYVIKDEESLVNRNGVSYYTVRFLCTLRLKDVNKFNRYVLKCKLLF